MLIDAPATKSPPPPPPNTACGIFNYTSPTTTHNYTLNSCPMTFHEGEAFCTARGAHLVTYGNLDEQLEVGAAGTAGMLGAARLLGSRADCVAALLECSRWW